MKTKKKSENKATTSLHKVKLNEAFQQAPSVPQKKKGEHSIKNFLIGEYYIINS